MRYGFQTNFLKISLLVHDDLSELNLSIIRENKVYNKWRIKSIKKNILVLKKRMKK